MFFLNQRFWKDEGAEKYATIPKSSFPRLLAQLMEKDYSSAITSGFAATGIFPLDPERVLRKLPADRGHAANAATAVEAQLLKKLSTMRYSQGKNARAKRPSNKDRLPAGESYTCTSRGDTRTGTGSSEEEDDEDNDDEENSNSSSSEEVDGSSEDDSGDGGEGGEGGKGSGVDVEDTDEEEQAENEKRSEIVRGTFCRTDFC